MLSPFEELCELNDFHLSAALPLAFLCSFGLLDTLRQGEHSHYRSGINI